MKSIGLHRKAKTSITSTKAVHSEKCIPPGEKTACVIVCHYVCHYVCHHVNTVYMSLREKCKSLREHHVITKTLSSQEHCMSLREHCILLREHCVYVITGTPCVCHHENTVCRSSRERRVYVITGTPCVCHRGKTVHVSPSV